MSTKLDEVARTISLALWDYDYTPRDPRHPDQRWSQALSAAQAVLEKHVGPLLSDAFEDGCARFWDHSTGIRKGPPESGDQYAARILAQLKEGK